MAARPTYGISTARAGDSGEADEAEEEEAPPAEEEDEEDDELEEDLEEDSEENLLDVTTVGLEEPYIGEETNSESDRNSQSPNGVAYPGGQDDTAEEDAVHPIASENYLPGDKKNNIA